MSLELQPGMDPLQIEGANDTAPPPCPHFGPCGGCQLQDITYAAQLAGKAARLRSLLRDVQPAGLELQVHGSPPLGYRNRIRLTLARVEGRLRAGYLRAASRPPVAGAAEADRAAEYATGVGPDEAVEDTALGKASFLPITQCPIAAPVLWRTAEAFLELATAAEWLRSSNLVPDQLELFTTADESKLDLTLYLRTAARRLPERIAVLFPAFCEALRGIVPELAGAGIALLPPAAAARSRRMEAPRPAASWGAPGINYAIPMTPKTSAMDSREAAHVETCWVPRGAFFQVNRFLLPELVEAVLEGAIAAGGDTSWNALAWDLYAGAGFFSRPLARRFGVVTAVEIAEASFSALGRTGLANLNAVRSTTLDFLRTAQTQRDRPDLIVLDPPRTGAGAEVCDLLVRFAARGIVYVSCAPERLATDLRTLTAAGYRVSALHLFDLFPQTTHIECVAVLTR